MINPSLYIDQSEGRGRGVFAGTPIPADTVVESAPVIIMTKEERALLDQTLLHDYIFEWGDDKEKCCMALGWVPVYNHNYTSNCEYFMDYEEEVIFIKTVRDIQEGEELTINYNGPWNDTQPVWFDAT